MTTPTTLAPRFRAADPETSALGAVDVDFRAGSQKHRLLKQFNRVSRRGLTSAEAAERAGLFRPGVCYWKRVSELAYDGLIEAGDTRVVDHTGSAQTVYRITDDGRAVLAAI